MNDLHKEKLTIIASDEYNIQSLRILFEKCANDNFPASEFSDDDALLGQKFRAYEIALKIMQDAFTDLENYREKLTKPKSFNKAK